MTEFEILNAAIFGISAFFASYLALSLMSRSIERRRMSRESIATRGDTMVFLVRSGRLIDANFAGHRYLEAFDKGGGLAALTRAVHAMFDDAQMLIEPADDRQSQTAISRDETMQAISETLGETVRLKLRSRLSNSAVAEDVHRLAALEAELETLRQTTDCAPYLVWRETANGVPIWINRAYIDTVREAFGFDRAAEWPLPRLFPSLGRGAQQRVSISVDESSDPRWFDCHSVPIGSDRLFTAFPADSTVRAETQLRDFMQTLTKTFSQLTVGLAIFDRDRNLALFNPALTQLTSLSPDFLAQRPQLTDFLDSLRDSRMMPEPRDYKEWRSRIAELEEKAEDGSYSETWSLPGNLTYRVTGRPHPDGAVALLFEDISAEMSLTRQFRRELEVGQSLLDNMEDATAYFAHGGMMIRSNRAYRRLWGLEDTETERLVADIDVVKASRVWVEATEPTPIWGDVREFVLETGERAEWDAQVKMRDGRLLDCRFFPCGGGGCQIVFRVATKVPVRAARILEVV